ncbi:MAG: hypothetical protein HY321_08060 [Armatimonadetes bacterium]|nr:hypothetical protein [Armatimonadota bacterium]
MINEPKTSMPDLGDRQPAEGDLDYPEGRSHLCCPEEELSSELPVEAGALSEEAGATERLAERAGGK